ncbi:MAG: 2Fe-2S iron-sulfur cluster binding domain-containing protein [Chrysiogenales bacterium]|nr:MAG: 2Fe-2S iron-sulfur cluster binding domain-containing protein [Chrysiogenales bacterium]
MLNFIVNNKEVKTDTPAGSSLVDFIRNELHLYGTKIGCRQGDCGACTILVGEIKDGELKYQTMNSCLMPLGNANHKHIVTIEGINCPELTPVQAAILDNNGTQCGFCTPGFVMSFYGFCLNADKEKNLENAIEAISGNICRCTGYKSLEKAAAAVVSKLQPMPGAEATAWLVKNNFLPDYFMDIPGKLKKITPPEPVAVQESGYIIAGGTDILLQNPQGAIESGNLNLVFGASAYSRIKFTDGKCYIGSTTTIRDLKESRELRKYIPRLEGYLKLMASTPIRNMATVGGNIANSSPIGDVCVILMALDATLVLRHKGETREIKLKDFLIGYKKVNKEPEEFIEWIYFELPDENTHFSYEKISKRGHLDMATANSAMRIVLADGVITKASFAVGALGPTIRYLEKTSAYLLGKKINNQTFKEANRIAQSEITPRSRAEYKRSLVRQQLFIHLMNFSPGTISLEALK